RSSHDDRFRVLYLFRSRPGGTPRQSASRLRKIVAKLRALNCFVTVYPLGPVPSDPKGETAGLPDDVEVTAGGSLAALSNFLASRRGYYELIFASDPEVLKQVHQLPDLLGQGFTTWTIPLYRSSDR